MDKITSVNQFLNRLTSYYSSSFRSDYEKEVWKDCTLEEIYNPNIDYDKLFKILVKSAYNGNFIPDTKQILEASKGCFKETESAKWIHVKIYNPILKAVVNTDCFPAGTSESTILNTYKKRFGGEGWQIIGV